VVILSSKRLYADKSDLFYFYYNPFLSFVNSDPKNLGPMQGQFFAHPAEPMDTPVPGAGIHRLIDSKPN